MIATMTIEEATDTDIFLAYLDEVLCPALSPGDVVVMDNLSAHKVQGVQQRIEAAGAEWLYLPPYSPDLNPIEKAWSKLKLQDYELVDVVGSYYICLEMPGVPDRDGSLLWRSLSGSSVTSAGP
jgi:hypothetical protein